MRLAYPTHLFKDVRMQGLVGVKELGFFAAFDLVWVWLSWREIIPKRSRPVKQINKLAQAIACKNLVKLLFFQASLE